MQASIVISAYNEGLGIENFSSILFDVLDGIEGVRFEVLWVNDGSSDNTQLMLEKIKGVNDTEKTRNIVIELSKNYGHEAAMIAGIDHAQGDVIICMDADGQHPPVKVIEMLEAFRNGNDVVLLERISREGVNPLKNKLSEWFYHVLNRLSSFKLKPNSTDFFLISNKVSNILKEHFRESNRFIRGYIQSVGFTSTTIQFDAPMRDFGETHYSFSSLLMLAFNALFSFSNKPLHFTIFISTAFVLFSLVLAGYSLYQYLIHQVIPSGYTTLVMFLSFSFAALFFVVSILSLYFQKALDEIRKRPIYIVKVLLK
jgi:dolichol-phosphate mannosyltransferase